MGEPSPANLSLPDKGEIEELLKLLHHEHPQAQLERSGDTWAVYTLHGVGATEEEALTNSIRSCKQMKADGQALPLLLDEIAADLKGTPGMSKARHQYLTELLNTASNCLNDGILTQTIPWILNPGYTRQIAELQRRVDMRLAMTAKEMADMEKARLAAGTKAPPTGAEYIPGQGVVKPRPTPTGGLWGLFK